MEYKGDVRVHMYPPPQTKIRPVSIESLPSQEVVIFVPLFYS